MANKLVFDETEVQKIAYDVCRGLHHCKQNSVPHCDITPSNIHIG